MLQYRSVTAITPQPPVVGLLISAEVSDTEHRFSEGTRWLPEQIGVDGAGVVAIHRNEDGTAGGKGTTASRAASLAEPRDEVLNEPFVAWVGERTSTLGGLSSERDFVARVSRALDAVESYQVAREWWDGSVLGAAVAAYTGDLVHPNNSDRVTTSALNVVGAFGALEAGLASVLGGRRGMIHCTPQVLVHAVAEQAVRVGGSPERPVYRSMMGHLVCADAGYSGNGPGGSESVGDGSSQWVYGTAPMKVLKGPRVVKPVEAASREAVDHNSNDLIVLAERPFVVQWDPTATVAAEVNIGTPADIGGAS